MSANNVTGTILDNIYSSAFYTFLFCVLPRLWPFFYGGICPLLIDLKEFLYMNDINSAAYVAISQHLSPRSAILFLIIRWCTIFSCLVPHPSCLLPSMLMVACLCSGSHRAPSPVSVEIHQVMCKHRLLAQSSKVWPIPASRKPPRAFSSHSKHGFSQKAHWEREGLSVFTKFITDLPYNQTF